MRWLVDLPVSMTAIDAQQTFAAEARTTAIGRKQSLEHLRFNDQSACVARWLCRSPSYLRRLFEQSDEGTPRVPPDKPSASVVFSFPVFF